MNNKRIISQVGLITLMVAFIFMALMTGISSSNASSNNKLTEDTLNIADSSDRIQRFPIVNISNVELKLSQKHERYNEQATLVREIYIIKTKEKITGSLFYNTYSFNNGDLYYYLRYEPTNSRSGAIDIVLPFKLDKFDLRTIEYPEGLDQTKSKIKHYVSQKADNNVLSTLNTGSVYIDSSSFNALFSYSSVYEKGSHRIRKEDYKRSKNIQIIDEGIIITLPSGNKSFSEQWGLISRDELVDWSSKEALEAVRVGDLNRVRKWGGDGQYYFMPSGYAPYSPNGFYRNSANHIGNRYLKTEGRLFEDYAYITIDTLIDTQNSDGYWGTDPMAAGLYDNYGVGAGFFDTRWDTEAALSLLLGSRKFNEPLFLQAAMKYADFYCDFANNNAYQTKNKGILVYDYGFNAIPERKTHVSLNHLLCEMNFFLEMFNTSKKYDYLWLANSIMVGINDTAEDWINKETGDLYYGYYGDGKYDVADYETLTLNDLIYAEQLYEGIYLKENPMIKMLIKAKEKYLTEAGIAF